MNQWTLILFNISMRFETQIFLDSASRSHSEQTVCSILSFGYWWALKSQQRDLLLLMSAWPCLMLVPVAPITYVNLFLSICVYFWGFNLPFILCVLLHVCLALGVPTLSPSFSSFSSPLNLDSFYLFPAFQPCLSLLCLIIQLFIWPVKHLRQSKQHIFI